MLNRYQAKGHTHARTLIRNKIRTKLGGKYPPCIFVHNSICNIVSIFFTSRNLQEISLYIFAQVCRKRINFRRCRMHGNYKPDRSIAYYNPQYGIEWLAMNRYAVSKEWNYLLIISGTIVYYLTFQLQTQRHLLLLYVCS